MKTPVGFCLLVIAVIFARAAVVDESHIAVILALSFAYVAGKMDEREE